MKKSIILIAAILLAAACDLTEMPKSESGRDTIFGSEVGLKAFTYGFYDYLPDRDNYFKQNTTADILAKLSIGTYEQGAYNEDTSTSWSWGSIRNVNYFIKYNVDTNVPEAVRANYMGIARFFRALLYFDKLVTYGPVPWVDEPLDPSSDRLYAPRDSRDVVISNIIADLDYAYENISETGITASSNTVNRWTALLLKSRVCLFEGTFRKYHSGGGSTYGDEYLKDCTITAEELLSQAADAAYTVMTKGPYRLHTKSTLYEAGGRGAYRDLFVSEGTQTDEVMLSLTLDDTHLGEANWYINSSSYGPHCCMTRAFAKTYLNLDGSIYNEKKSDGSYKNFVEETTGRDYRLCQTIRGADYTRKDASGSYVRTAPNLPGHSLTGYQITKYVTDDVTYDDKRSNTNDVPLARYAEVLLNYAEAKAELGTITNEDWSATIGALRRRAGITGGDLDTKPTKVDSYLQKTFYPNVTDPCILEVRRDRAIELYYEGFRLKDLKRWALGDNWETVAWEGIYIPEMNTALDINGDGIADVYVAKSQPSDNNLKKIYMPITGSQGIRQLSDDPKGGYVLTYTLPRKWNANMYLYPIPTVVAQKNPALGQNPGWKLYEPKDE